MWCLDSGYIFGLRPLLQGSEISKVLWIQMKDGESAVYKLRALQKLLIFNIADV